MEKRGEIKRGWTPPATTPRRTKSLAEHVTKRAADSVKKDIQKKASHSAKSAGR